MATKRNCYQCGDDDIVAIQAARTEQIRAHAARVLAEADAKFNAEKAAYTPASSEVDDWSILDEPVEEQPAVAPVEVEKVDADVLAATEPQDAFAEKVAESPKPEEQANVVANEGEPEAEEEKPAKKAPAKAKAATSKDATDSK